MRPQHTRAVSDGAVPLLNHLFDIIGRFVDPDKALDRMNELSNIEKLTDFSSFEESCRFLHGLYSRAGLNTEILGFPADGRGKYQCWTSPIGFRTDSARCEIVAPTSILLGDRGAEPNTAVVGGGHTGPEGVVGYVVEVSDEDELRGDSADRSANRSADRSVNRILFSSTLSATELGRFAECHHCLAVVSSALDGVYSGSEHVKWCND